MLGQEGLHWRENATWAQENSFLQENSHGRQEQDESFRTTIRDKVLLKEQAYRKTDGPALPGSQVWKNRSGERAAQKNNEEIEERIRLLSEEVNSLLQVSIGALKQKQLSLHRQYRGAAGKLNYPGRKRPRRPSACLQQSRKILEDIKKAREARDAVKKTILEMTAQRISAAEISAAPAYNKEEDEQALAAVERESRRKIPTAAP